MATRNQPKANLVRTIVRSGSVMRPATTAPPAYRPQPIAKVLQTKQATFAQNSRRPVASPALRTQATPKAMQPQIAHGIVNRKPAVAPPVYRPSAQKLVQQKTISQVHAPKVLPLSSRVKNEVVQSKPAPGAQGKVQANHVKVQPGSHRQQPAVIQRHITVGILRYDRKQLEIRLKSDNAPAWNDAYLPALRQLDQQNSKFKELSDVWKYLENSLEGVFKPAIMERFSARRYITLQAWDNQNSKMDPGHMQLYDHQQDVMKEYRITDKPYFYEEPKPRHQITYTPTGGKTKTSVVLEPWTGSYQEGNLRQLDREWAKKKRFTRVLEIKIAVTEAELFKLGTLFKVRGLLGAAHFYGEAGALDPLAAKCMSFLTDLANMRGWKVPIKNTVYEMLLEFANEFPEDVVGRREAVYPERLESS